MFHTVTERAFQIWPLLVQAARQKQILTYPVVEYCTGMDRRGLGRCLEPIQSYCLVRGFPPLTILVVKTKSGLPGTGFTGTAIKTPEDFAKTLQSVFDFDWFGRAPSVTDLQQAVAVRPSNGV